MQLAKKTATLDKCPLVDDKVRAVLEEASQPAIRLVEIGAGDNKVLAGNETVFFRHEEKFHHPTLIGFIFDDDMKEVDLDEALREVRGLSFERVGQKIGVDLIALRGKTKNKQKFLSSLSRIRQQSNLNLVLMPATSEILSDALRVCAQDKPLVSSVLASDPGSFASLCKEYKLPLAFCATNLNEFADRAKKLTQEGLADIVLNISESRPSERLWQLTQIRRLAIKKNERRLGFPTMVILEPEDARGSVSEAASCIAKYASIVLLKTRRPEHILPLLTWRQNIFTDPQKPLQVEPKVYPVGSAHADSPVLVTTNFSLTYYTVLGEIEASRIPSHLICVDTEGMSVLTAWAAEKFTPEKIADTLIEFKLSDLVKHKNLIIPGYVAMMSGDLEEKSGWKILVGPREAAGITGFLKNLNITG